MNPRLEAIDQIELKNIELWSQPNCLGCNMVKNILTNIYKVPYTERMIQDELTKEEFYSKFPEAKTIPQIIIDGVWIGGLLELQWMARNDRIKTVNLV
jgi:glutaredoxin 3